MRANLNGTLLLGALVLGAAQGTAAGDAGLDMCVQAAKKEQQGHIIKAEALEIAGRRIYELEIQGADGAETEVMCEASSGRILETEGEAESADDPMFAKGAAVSEEEAIRTALAAHPGKVHELEYELKAGGRATYEIDIVGEDGAETKVEVDAGTGEIIEVAREIWQIGLELDEMR